MRLRVAALALLACAPVFAWTESVEFAWRGVPRQSWERELVWLKNIGIRHVSLPPADDPAAIAGVISIVRRLGMEADLEGPIPPPLQPLAKEHGGPLTPALAGASRLSVLQTGALSAARDLLLKRAPAVIWTDVEDTLTASEYRAGAVSFAGQERPASATLRRNAQLAGYWADALASLEELPGAGTRLPTESIAVRQFVSPDGMSLVSVANASPKQWTGDIRAMYTAVHRTIVLPNVTVRGNDTVWLPIGVPLTASALCRDCVGFSTQDHLVYATSEITGMEYENGILALEFSAPGAGEVVAQFSRQPSGPLVAGGKPAMFDWDDRALRARLPVPAAQGATNHVRIGLAMQPPDSTAFFDAARVLLIGEVNKLTAQFSSDAIAHRSRLLAAPGVTSTQEGGKQPLEMVYSIKVAENAVHGDHADLALEADGSRLSHAHPQLLRPVTLRFGDAISVRAGAQSPLQLSPATIPMNRRNGRDFTITLRNNAPEIRTFQVSVNVPGLDISPPKMSVTVGASDSRDLTFRVFPNADGLRSGEVVVSGAAKLTEPLRFVVIPSGDAVAWSAEGFSFLESQKTRAVFMPGWWFELLNKDNGANLLQPGGIEFAATAIQTRGDALAFTQAAGEKVLRLTDLEALIAKPKR